MTKARWIAMAAGVTAASCGSSGAGPDAGTDAAIDGGSEWECPDPIAASCGEDLAIPRIFEASEFGEGTRFVDVAPFTILAERDVGATRTISIIACLDAYDSCTAASATIARLEVPTSSGLHAVAVAAGGTPFGAASPSHMAVLCDDAACALWGANLVRDVPDSELTAVPGGGIPDTTIVHGLWWSVEAPICAYGDGIHCFDGSTWSSPVPSGVDRPLFNDLESFYSTGFRTAIAVGDDGLMAWPGFPGWYVSWNPNRQDWYTVAAADEGYAIAGEGGALRLQADRPYIGCPPLSDEDVVLLAAWGREGRQTTGVTASGRVFMTSGPPATLSGACYTGQVVGTGSRGVVFDCGISANLFLMDEAALYGTTYCPIE